MDPALQEPTPAPRRRGRLLVVGAVVALLAVAVAAGLVIRGRDTESWTLVWSDEFDSPTLSAQSWRAESFTTFGDGNQELACLTDRPENLSVADGRLRLVARREAPPLRCGSHDDRFPQGRSYSSAFVSTEGLRSWRYPRIEIRAALPLATGTSKGLWPAFWMRPDDKAAGELDILEGIGSGSAQPAVLQQTVHYSDQGKPAKKTAAATVPEGFDPTQFHVYAMAVHPDRIDWLVDGEVTFTVDSDKVPALPSTLDRSWFLRMNLAVGGTWPGDPTPQTELPAALEVDWVKVYENSG